MRLTVIFLCALCAVPSVFTAAATATGSVELNELTFEKITSKFDATLVKFDVAFPYGDKHDAFINLSKDAKDVDELLIAEVGVKDYGEKDNEALARKYGATKENFPVVKLFVKGNSEPYTFDDSKGFTSDELRKFVREKTGLYLSLPGCVRQLDQLAVKIMEVKKDEKKKIVKEVEKKILELQLKDVPSARIYKTIMEKIIEKGDDFVVTETERVKKILSGKLSEDKKKEIGIRMNILQSFQLKGLREPKQEL